MNGTEICRRVDVLKAHRSNIESIWNVVERLIMPLRIGNMYQRNVTETQIEYDREDIYDSTAIWAAQKFAASIHGTVTNPAFKWFEYQFKDKKLRQDKEAAAWLQECTEIAYEELYDSNFDSEISSSFQDMVGLGNTFLSTEVENDSIEAWEGFNFCAVPLKESFFERDHRGNLVRFYRWLEWTAEEISSKYPKGQKLPEEIAKELKEGGDPEKRFTVIYCVYERKNKRRNRGKLTVLAPEERPYGYKHVLKSNQTELGKEDGCYDMPISHAPWEKTSGSKWGHGPGMVMAPTVEYINSWLEMQDMAVRKQVDPPWFVRERGLLSDLNQKPGQFTLVKDPERDAKPMLSNGRIDFSQMTLKELREMVREAFHENELQLKQSPQMSATEAQIRYDLMNRVLGPTMGRIQNSLLDPTLMRVFMSCLRNKRFPDMPASVIKAKAQFKVHYSGPLVRAQKQDEVASMDRFMGDIGAMAKMFPVLANAVNPMEWAREKAERMGIPAKILRTQAEAERMTQQQQQFQAMMAKAQLQEQQGKGQQAVQEAQQ
jgi:hypothetical protein